MTIFYGSSSFYCAKLLGHLLRESGLQLRQDLLRRISISVVCDITSN